MEREKPRTDGEKMDDNLWLNYMQKRNKYVMILRVEQKNYQKDIVDKCKDQPKLFYRYTNGKLEKQKEIDKQIQQ